MSVAVSVAGAVSGAVPVAVSVAGRVPVAVAVSPLPVPAQDRSGSPAATSIPHSTSVRIRSL